MCATWSARGVSATARSNGSRSATAPTPLEEERPYWEEYFDLIKVQDAHARSRCRDLNGDEPWACSDCDCTEKLEARLTTWGPLFLDTHLRLFDISTQRRKGAEASSKDEVFASSRLCVET